MLEHEAMRDESARAVVVPASAVRRTGKEDLNLYRSVATARAFVLAGRDLDEVAAEAAAPFSEDVADVSRLAGDALEGARLAREHYQRTSAKRPSAGTED